MKIREEKEIDAVILEKLILPGFAIFYYHFPLCNIMAGFLLVDQQAERKNTLCHVAVTRGEHTPLYEIKNSMSFDFQIDLNGVTIDEEDDF